MKSSLRKVMAVAFATLAALATVTDAAAEGGDPGVTSTTVSKLPSAKLLLPTKAKVPATISAGEKSAGFVIAMRKGSNGYFAIVGSAKAAKEENTGAIDGAAAPREACFAEDSAVFRGFGGERDESPWRSNLQERMHMSPSQRGGQRAPVSAVHSERIAEENGRVSLEVVDAWVDPNTRGVRLIGRATLPLELVATVLGGTKLYAARDGQSVHVILVRPNDRKRGGHDPIFATADNTAFNSSCDHIGVTVKAEKGSAQTATVISSVELPSVATTEPVEPKPDADGATPSRPALREVRVRPVHVQASVMWASRDKEPVLTISAGWDSRERTGVGL